MSAEILFWVNLVPVGEVRRSVGLTGLYLLIARARTTPSYRPPGDNNNCRHFLMDEPGSTRSQPVDKQKTNRENRLIIILDIHSLHHSSFASPLRGVGKFLMSELQTRSLLTSSRPQFMEIFSSALWQWSHQGGDIVISCCLLIAIFQLQDVNTVKISLYGKSVSYCPSPTSSHDYITWGYPPITSPDKY